MYFLHNYQDLTNQNGQRFLGMDNLITDYYLLTTNSIGRGSSHVRSIHKPLAYITNFMSETDGKSIVDLANSGSQVRTPALEKKLFKT